MAYNCSPLPWLFPSTNTISSQTFLDPNNFFFNTQNLLLLPSLSSTNTNDDYTVHTKNTYRTFTIDSILGLSHVDNDNNQKNNHHYYNEQSPQTC